MSRDAGHEPAGVLLVMSTTDAIAVSPRDWEESEARSSGLAGNTVAAAQSAARSAGGG